jgi:hypothetical protein
LNDASNDGAMMLGINRRGFLGAGLLGGFAAGKESFDKKAVA